LLIESSFFITGVGLAISLTINIVFTTTLKNGTVMNGIFQGTYGIGGSIGPLIGTSIVSHGLPWSRFYAMCLGLAAFNLFFSGWAYRNYEEDAPTLAERVDSYEAHGTTRWAAFKKILSNKIAVLGAAFVFAYQGSEVAISGWVISFLVNYRGGDPSKVGYVTSGFWAGVTLGM
jgi:fucose permease